MALQFEPPPDWLIKAYMERPDSLDKGNQMLNTIGTGINEYEKRKQLRQALALKQAENARQERELAMKGRQSFYEYGDPSGLSYQEQTALQPVQGPTIPYESKQQISGQEGPLSQSETAPLQPSYDPNNPSDYHSKWLRDYAENLPQGTKGQLMTSDTIIGPDGERTVIQRPIKGKTIMEKGSKLGDQKRTFQLKGFVTGEDGKQIPISYDTRTGQLVKGEGTDTPILPTVAPSIPGAEVSKIGDLENMKEKLGVIDRNYSPQYVGMVDNKLQAIKQKTGFGATGQAANFRQAVQDIKDSLLRARSGAQINEQEYQRLLPLVPDETMSEVDFLAKRARFEEVLNSIIAEKKKAFSSAGYRPMGESTPSSNNALPKVGETFQGGKVLNIKRIK